jgi:hypothetical protein
MTAVAAGELVHIHLVLAPELVGLNHILSARIEALAQRRDCVERGQPEVCSVKDVVASQCRFRRVLVQVVRRRLIGDEVVGVGRTALVVKEQAVLGILRGRQVDKIEELMVLAAGNMGVDVWEAGRPRLEKHMDWTWGRCSGPRVLKEVIVDVAATSEWAAGVLLCCLKSAANLEGISDQKWKVQLVLTNLTSMVEEDHSSTSRKG